MTKCLYLYGGFDEKGRFSPMVSYTDTGAPPPIDDSKQTSVGNAVIELRDSKGEIVSRTLAPLITVCVHPAADEPPQPSPPLLATIITCVEDAASIRILVDDEPRWELETVGTSAKLSVDWAAAVEGPTTGPTVTWRVIDDKSSELRFALAVQEKGSKQSRRLLTTWSKETSAAIPEQCVPSGSGEFVLLCSDGLHLIELASPPFEVPPGVCCVDILSPSDGAMIDRAAPVHFHGYAFYDEWPQPRQTTFLRWRSSFQGDLGDGECIEQVLLRGEHKITLEGGHPESASKRTIVISVVGSEDAAPPEVNKYFG